MLFKTKEDLDKVLSANKPESVIRLFWLDSQKDEKLKKFENTLRDLYIEEYPSEDYLVYVSKDVEEEGTSFIYEDGSYENEEVESEEDGISLIKVLTAEAQALLDAGKVKPTYELYKEEKIEEFLSDPTNLEVDMNLYIEFIKSIIKERISNLADEKSDLAEAYLAGKESISLKQVERYKRKYDLAVKCKAANDFTVLDTEASLVGITGAELADLIIAQGDAWNLALDNFYALIEAYRVRANMIADSLTTLDEVSLAFKLLEESKSFNADTTPADVEAVFANF